MSAAAHWEVATEPRVPRRHLRVVPTGARARGGGRVGVRVQPAGMRLTARGRRMLVVVPALAVLVAGGVAARAWATTPASPVRTVTVDAGETLWQVAHRAYPQLPVSDAVTKIALANDLNGLQVVAGERLQLPR